MAYPGIEAGLRSRAGAYYPFRYRFRLVGGPITNEMEDSSHDSFRLQNVADEATALDPAQLA